MIKAPIKGTSADGARSHRVRRRTDVQNNTSESSEDHPDRQPDITDSCLSQDLENTREKIPTSLSFSFTFKAGLIRPQRILDILLLVLADGAAAHTFIRRGGKVVSWDSID